MKCLNACTLKTAGFELVQRFLPCYRIW